MKQKIFFIPIFLIILYGCFSKQTKVYFSEMSQEPEINTYEKKFRIRVYNSAINSALVIYKINYEINYNFKEIYLSGYQAINKNITDTFYFDISQLNINNLSEYKFYWINPDSTKNQITTHNIQTFKGRAMNLKDGAAFIWEFACSEAYYLENKSEWEPEFLDKEITIEGELVQFEEGKSILKNWQILETK